MRTLFIDCGMGAAGDMLMGALLSLIPDKDAFIENLNQIGIPDVQISYRTDCKCGITGLHVSVKARGVEEESVDVHEHQHQHHHHEQEMDEQIHTEESSHHHHETVHEHSHHHHASMAYIQEIISGLKVSDKVKTDVSVVYQLIAHAEAKVHGKEITEIHFHEVGMMDALADITGCAMLMEMLDVWKVVVSPVNVGYGKVKCAHGILPVPAPATIELLSDIPCYAGRFEGELCTPTGAALLAYYGTDYAQMPNMRIKGTGYGTGKKEFEAANVVRVVIGETDSETDTVIELCCNLDDMTGEEIGYVMELLLKNGALDVFTTPIGMKKSRPGQMLSVLCKQEQRSKVAEILLKHTTTIGLREYRCNRMILNRREEAFESSFGTVHVKKSTGFGVTKEKMEYEDIKSIADREGLSLQEVKAMIQQEMYHKEEC